VSTSIVIAAHNEARVIGRCLDGILGLAEPGEFEIVVVANGCTDATADTARERPGVTVIELTEASKTAALRAGDEAAKGFPRVYLDADTTLGTAALRSLCAALDEPGVYAVTARRRLDTAASPLAVRGYYAIQRRLPAFDNALFGRGVVVLSAAGRGRFERFPSIVADDLFLDSLFTDEEKREVETVVSTVAVPRRTRDLVRRLARVRQGNRALRALSPRTRPAVHSSWLRDVVLPRPWLLPAGACYAGITLAAEWRARRAVGWAQDESSRETVIT
jgi:glycosyltransferase involved in cell wall biosynthesis